jgi:RNA polymerase sigma-70 factor (ECF subfamily)
MDDRALISRILAGETSAFRLLVERHQRLVAHMIARVVDQAEDREELCQDVFVRVYDKLGEFSFQSKLSTWIATIAYRHAINHVRKRQVKWSELPEDDRWQERWGMMETPAEILEDEQMEAWVKQLINQLPVHYRTVLTLYHLEHFDYREIGEATGMPEGTVKNYLFRARHLLKEKVLLFQRSEEV